MIQNIVIFLTNPICDCSPAPVPRMGFSTDEQDALRLHVGCTQCKFDLVTPSNQLHIFFALPKTVEDSEQTSSDDHTALETSADQIDQTDLRTGALCLDKDFFKEAGIVPTTK